MLVLTMASKGWKVGLSRFAHPLLVSKQDILQRATYWDDL